ncbi:Maf family nucleotide pyrophosphatase [Ponticaulis sp.]|uniref:Maf family nucleotide pyrophosphatase n=1 Tax=Ponticaulis sp. TaxID=2020902 RepID=UPI000B6E830F|nr:Maf family nucleotide pyrophosphatase [Ponticaulis sp.]MAI91021.1 septum formation protein Maf [Ponticaulis sp.]MAZ25649.1 septum formation protein Maf [Cytophagaceae bacterium]OUX98358.1 MAG: septum formation protein Maf [Hyphomonadaceae bacterium TMED5]|tara:strand:- start:114610 stop:115206 length:597 start_codon:yes stop_codon:yes gene_type:complete
MSDELILASGSKIRATILQNAGLKFRVQTSRVDEDSLKDAMRHEGMSPRDQADYLAQMKSEKVSSQTPGLVIGADQMMSLDGKGFDKPKSREEAFERLKEFSGKTHYLECAAVISQNGEAVWRYLARPKLTMRELSDSFINEYLDQIGEAAYESVGAYQLEGLGVQLFSEIEGDYFSILGVPLLQILTYLRDRGVISK